MPTTPIIAPDGTVADIPNEHVADLVAKGGQVGVDLLAPTGERAVVPLEHAKGLMAKGAQLIGAPPAQPPGQLPITPPSSTVPPFMAHGAGALPMSPAEAQDVGHQAVGAAKGLGSTINNVGMLLQKLINGTAPPGIPSLNVVPDNPEILKPAPNETGGYGAEQVGEFLAPGGMIGKAGKAAEAATAAKTGMKVLPTIARALTEGGAMGGIEALHGGDAKDVAATAGLGAAGPLVEEGAGAVGKALASKFPSMNPTDAIVSALAPAKKIAKTLPANVDRAMPLLLDAEHATGTTIDSVDALADNARAARQKVWSQVEAAQSAAGAKGAMVVGQSAGDAGMQAALSADKVQPVSDETWAAIQRDVDFYGKPTSPVDAEQRIQTLNAQLKTFYGKSGVDQASVLKANPEMAAKAAIAGALRTDLDSTMQAATGTGAKDLKTQYAALRQIESAALDRSARIGVSDARQQFAGKNLAGLYAKPVGLAIPGAIDAGFGMYNNNPKQVARGAGEAAIGAYVGKTSNADSLIEAAFNGARSGGSKIATAAKAANALTVPAARTAAGILGSYYNAVHGKDGSGIP